MFGDYCKDASIVPQFAAVSCDGYANINEIYPQTDRIFGTETLCGDYSGRVLILAQDFSTAERVRDRSKNEPGQNPFRHRETNETNLRLVEVLQHLGALASGERFTRARNFGSITADGTNATTCGAVYGSIVWLLKDTKSVSSAHPNKRQALEASSSVIKSAIGAMPNLDRIVCLGSLAYQGLASMFGLKRRWRSDLTQLATFSISNGSKEVTCFPTSHLSPLGLAARAGISRGIRPLDACKNDFERALA